MASSGSTTTSSAATSTAGGRANPTAKSIALPSSTTRSAAASASENVPSAGSRSPRGLSIGTTGHPEGGLERRDPGTVPAPVHARTGEDDRPFRSGDSANDVGGDRTRERPRAAFELRRPGPASIAGIRIEHVERQRDVRRSRPPRARAGDGGGGVMSELLDADGAPGGLDERARDIDLRQLLERAVSVGAHR